MTMSQSERLFQTFNVMFLSVVGLVTLFPFYYIFVVSFTDPVEFAQRGGLILIPRDWSDIAYRYLLSSKAFVRAIGVSSYLAIVGTICNLVVTSCLAYAVSQPRLRGRRVIMLGVLITILFNPGIIPGYLVIRELGLINSLEGLIISSLSSGFYVLLMKGFFESMPPNLEEAARIDGCSDLGVWRRIILPLSLPAMAAFGLFYAVAYWNTYFSAILLINDPKKWPLQVLLQNMLSNPAGMTAGADAAAISAEVELPSEQLKMAAVVIATVPILCVYPFLQKHFAKGAMLGSVKG